jgi:protein SCO1
MTTALKRGVLWAVAVSLAVAGIALVALPKSTSGPWHGTRFDPPRPPAGFSLQSADGPVSLGDLRGKVVVLFFGFTYCPDVCPLALSKLATAVRSLGARAKDVRVVMVSVDPERDTPEKMQRYTRGFHPDFLGLTGTPQQIAETAAAYGIHYRKRTLDSAAGYVVDHTASIQALDRKGAATILWRSSTEADQITADLRKLVRLR